MVRLDLNFPTRQQGAAEGEPRGPSATASRRVSIGVASRPMRSLISIHVAVGAAAILFSSILGCGSNVGITGGTAGSGGAGGSGGVEANPDELFAPGPYEVGYREFPLTYSAAASGDDRELLLRVWYPAAPDSGADPATLRAEQRHDQHRLGGRHRARRAAGQRSG